MLRNRRPLPRPGVRPRGTDRPCAALERMGWYFDRNGTLKNMNHEIFRFTTQRYYDDLGEAVTQEVYRQLEEKARLIKIPLQPIGTPLENPEDIGFIYVSPNCQKKDILLVLFHGSGVVRAGQWARRLIINQNMRCGSMMPFVMRAQEQGWGVVVLNTNHNGEPDRLLKYSETPIDHAKTAWKTWVETSEAKKIFVLAHSRGGGDLSAVLRDHGHDERLSTVILTDSWFEFSDSLKARVNPVIVINFLAQGTQEDPTYRIRDFVRDEVHKLYAGTDVHEWSTYCAIDAIFNIFQRHINVENFKEVMDESKYMVSSDKDEVHEDDRDESDLELDDEDEEEEEEVDVEGEGEETLGGEVEVGDQLAEEQESSNESPSPKRSRNE